MITEMDMERPMIKGTAFEKESHTKNAGGMKVYKKVLVMTAALKELISGHSRKVMIACALNLCIQPRTFEIIGYLITRRRVLLIVESKEKQLDTTWKAMEEYLHQEIVNSRKSSTHEIPIDYQEIGHGNPLFNYSPLYNDVMVKLLTGRNPDIPYFSPQVARFTNMIQHYAFCSALDYSGGESAVKVTVRPEPFWTRQKEKITTI